MTAKNRKKDKQRKKTTSKGSRAGSRTAEPPMRPGGPMRRTFTTRHASLLVLLVSILLYANTINHDFVWDDYILIVDNRDVQRLDIPTVARIFTGGLFENVDASRGQYYRPLVTLSYHIDYHLFGGNPHGFHAMNVLWNALACVLVFLFLYSLFRNMGLALVSALLFAAYPLHTENVAFVSNRTDILAAFWSFVSLLCYVHWRRRGTVLMLFASLGGFVLALLAKESAACLPALIVLLEVGPFKPLLAAENRPSDTAALRRNGRGVVACILFFAFLAVFMFIRQTVLGDPFIHKTPFPGFLGHVALPLSIFGGYVLKVLFPFNLDAEYDAPVPAAFFDSHVLGGAVLAAAMVWSLWRFRRRPDVVLAIGIFIFGLVPVLNIIPIAEISAERFLYFPSLGPALVLGSLFASAFVINNPASPFTINLRSEIAWKLSPFSARIGVLMLMITLIGFAGRTVIRNMDWKNEETLFKKTISQQPDNVRAYTNLAQAAYRRGDIPAAVDSYRKALALNPDYPYALSGLAGIYVQAGRSGDALPLMERAVRIVPDNAQYVSNLGSVYFELGRYAEAAEQFERTLKMDPNEFRAHFNLGLVRLEQGDLASARSHLEESLKGGPEFNIAYFYLAKLEKDAGDTERVEFYARRFLASHHTDDSIRREAEALLDTGE